jgi:hypothetical protein
MPKLADRLALQYCRTIGGSLTIGSSHGPSNLFPSMFVAVFSKVVSIDNIQDTYGSHHDGNIATVAVHRYLLAISTLCLKAIIVLWPSYSLRS